MANSIAFSNDYVRAEPVAVAARPVDGASRRSGFFAWLFAQLSRGTEFSFAVQHVETGVYLPPI